MRNSVCQPSARPVAQSITAKYSGSDEVATPASQGPNISGESGGSSGM